MSAATVSRVLSNAGGVSVRSRSKVLSAANRLGYFAGSSVEGLNLAVGYFGAVCWNSAFDSELWAGMGASADEANVRLTAINMVRTRHTAGTFTEAFRQIGVRGAIIRSVRWTRHITEELIAEGFPMVLVSDRDAKGSVARVFSDSFPASRAGVQHLLDLGHTRVAVGSSDLDDSDHADRVNAYREAMTHAGLPIDEGHIISVKPSLEGGVHLFRNIMSMSRRPTAVYVTDPIVAVGLINHAHKMGVDVPGQLSVLGFDDAAMREMVFPKMTCVCQDAQRLGVEAFNVMMRLLSQPPGAEPETRVLPTWLEINGTTAPPPSEVLRVMPDGSRSMEPLNDPAVSARR